MENPMLTDEPAIQINNKKIQFINILIPAIAVSLLFIFSQSIMMFIKGVIFTILLFIASKSDISTREVDNYLSVMIIITAFIGINESNIFEMLAGLLIVPLPLFISAIIKQGSIGGADIKVMAANAFLLGIQKGLIALIMGLLLAVICMFIIRKIGNKDIKEAFPLIPYLSISSYILFLN